MRACTSVRMRARARALWARPRWRVQYWEPEEEAGTCEAGRGAWVADGGRARTTVLGVRGLPGGRREPGDGAPAVSGHRTDSGTTAPPSREVGQGLAGRTGVQRALCTGRLDFHGERGPQVRVRDLKEPVCQLRYR